MVKEQKQSSPRILRGQAGQAITEAILLLVIFLATTFAVVEFFKGQEVFASLIKKPWASFSGVLQNGVWASPKDGGGRHANTHSRHVSLEPESAR